MPRHELMREIESGVQFYGLQHEARLLGVMGMQPVRDATLIRHAYVRPDAQRSGVGSALLEAIVNKSQRPVLVGTWAAATWAVGFYQRHGFKLLPPSATVAMLHQYWQIAQRQIDTSVVLRLD